MARCPLSYCISPPRIPPSFADSPATNAHAFFTPYTFYAHLHLSEFGAAPLTFSLGVLSSCRLFQISLQIDAVLIGSGGMRGGCAVKSSPGGDYSVMSRILLRFRPIAPKPAGGEGVSAAAEQERGSGGGRSGRRAKRKYVRARGRQSGARRDGGDGGGKPSPPARSEIEDGSSPEKGAVTMTTLQLLPERSSESDKSCGSSSLTPKLKDIWNIDQYKLEDEVNCRKADTGGGDATAVAAFGNIGSVTKTWIIVECVTETLTDTVAALGFSAGEMINSLQMDTCPGFVSDGMNKVVWVNEAYRKLVAGAAGDAAENGLTACLVVKEELPYFIPSFACRVRMIQQSKYGQKWNKIMPCDVWRMEFAGFAWKLDVKTALGLAI